MDASSATRITGQMSFASGSQRLLEGLKRVTYELDLGIECGRICYLPSLNSFKCYIRPTGLLWRIPFLHAVHRRRTGAVKRVAIYNA